MHDATRRNAVRRGFPGRAARRGLLRWIRRRTAVEFRLEFSEHHGHVVHGDLSFAPRRTVYVLPSPSANTH